MGGRAGVLRDPSAALSQLASEIEARFEASGWTRFIDSAGHVLFYNYAFQVLAIDALPRNCYVNADGLLPFDVILCRPDAELEQLLGLCPP